MGQKTSEEAVAVSGLKEMMVTEVERKRTDTRSVKGLELVLLGL